MENDDKITFYIENVIPYLIKPPLFLEELLKQNCVLKVKITGVLHSPDLYFAGCKENAGKRKLIS